MAIQAVLETLDGVDDAIKTLYVQEGDKFYLDLDETSLREHKGVTPLANAFNSTKAERDAAKKAAADLKAQIAELQKGAPDTAAMQARLSEMQEKLAAKEAEAGEWSQKYLGVTKDQAIKAALAGHGVTDPNAQRLASLDISRFVEVDDKGAAFVKDDFGAKTLDQFLKGWLAKDGAFLVAKPSGGGAQGGTGRTAGAQVKTRAEFDALSPPERTKFLQSGGKLEA